MRIHLKALGCRLNEAELENWATDFQANGHTITATPDNAELIVINTCAVTNEAVKKSRQLIKRSHRNNPNAKLIVSGCYATLNPDIDNKISAIDMIITNRDKDSLVDIIKREILPESMPSIATEPGESSLFMRGRHRAFVKIQDGCRYRCTFCIVTVARGNERSRAMHDIITQINDLHGQGVNEVVLTGVHVGGYGHDINVDLQALIQAILLDTDIPRLRLASVEPWDLPDNFFRLFQNPRLMPHIHLPLQSGSDIVLRQMARRCKTGDYEKLIVKARTEVPDFNVTTDIIVGFPGETEREWQTSLTFIENIGFSHLHIFPYSARSGTKAAELSDQLSPAVKKMRCRQLSILGKRIKQEILQTQIGKEFPVLFENSYSNEDGKLSGYSGYTTNYLRIQLAAEHELAIENKIKNVRVMSLTKNSDALLTELV